MLGTKRRFFEREGEEKNPLEGMKNLYEDEGPALGAYKEHLSSIPQQEDYKNSFGRKLLAGLAGSLQAASQGAGAGIQTTEGILNSRYKNAMGDYAAKASGLKEAAGIEAQGTNAKIKYLIDSQDIINKEKKTEIDSRRADADAVYKNRTAGARERDSETNAARAGSYDRSVRVQEETAPIRAKASMMSAAAAQSNAASNATRTGIYGEDVAIRRDKEKRLANQPPRVQAYQAKDAEKKALLDVLGERPEFAEFVDEKGNLKLEIEPGKETDFRLFRELLETKKRKRLTGGDISLPDIEEEADEEDYEVLEP